MTAVLPGDALLRIRNLSLLSDVLYTVKVKSDAPSVPGEPSPTFTPVVLSTGVETAVESASF